MLCCLSFFVFKQKTAYKIRISDWISVVCSSDLSDRRALRHRLRSRRYGPQQAQRWPDAQADRHGPAIARRILLWARAAAVRQGADAQGRPPDAELGRVDLAGVRLDQLDQSGQHQ